MNKNTRIYIGILLILILIFAFVKLSDNKTEKRIRFFDVDSLEIATIILSSSTDTLRLDKTSSTWTITSPVTCEVNPQNIDDFFDKVLTVETSSIPVSESTSSHSDFNVTDSLGFSITLLDSDEKILNESIVGKSSNYNFSHGRTLKTKEVYQLNSNISTVLNPNLNRWRKKEIFEIPEENIMGIQVQMKESNYQLMKSDSLWIASDGLDDVAIDPVNSTLKSIIDNLKIFRASDFVDANYEEYSELMSDPEFIVTITDINNNIINLKFAKLEEKKYILQLDEQQDPLYIVYDHMAKRFIKTLEDFR